MIRVLVCDGLDAVPPGLQQAFSAGDDLHFAGQAHNSPEALALVRQGGIDLVLMDIAMPQRDGPDVMRQLRSEFPRLPVLMFGTCPDKQFAVRSLKLGAAGYLSQGADAGQAIRQVAAGGLYLTAGGHPLQ